MRLNPDRCKGCVNCTKRCPTEAIRIRDGKALITESRCIDCGECIRRCPSHAKTATTDELSQLAFFQYNIALPAPALYAQFNPDTSIESILCGLLKLGFDEVFEVAQGAEIVSLAIRDYLKRDDVKKPAISSACPAVVRLIQVRFPELIDNLIPIDAPVEVAARIVRGERSRDLKLEPEQIGIWFITPCPAKMTSVKQPLGSEKSNLTGAIAMSQIYGDLLKVLPSAQEKVDCRRASWSGVGWAMAGGETTAVGTVINTLVVHEIHNVADVLEQVALGKLKNIDYIEVLACAGGCIGGPLTVENRFVAEHRMRQRIRQMREDEAKQEKRPPQDYREVELGVAERRAIEPRPVMRLDEDIFKALYKVELMEKTLQKLPGLDCGSCGSPNCKALAEDIAQGRASETDCVFKLREKVRDLAWEMVDLAGKLPPSLHKDSEED
ncbi:iron hydrogenase [Lucifera butyrica]|uniref:Iron hydrogenase n=1 Tax=Lucifera butyrica TaxID=1351585 RepID=A0A498R7T0_9FIRM|nr:iron hydrogenase [Lucifera butyrica]